MLKLLFALATLTASALANSDIAVQWMCAETRSMGNCTSIPKITDLLQIISENSDNYEYTDIYYCPYKILERQAKCMQSYFDSCYSYMPEQHQILLEMHLTPMESSETLCVKGRPYKKEFREHMTCTNALLKAEHQWNHYLNQQQMAYGQFIDDMGIHEKCQIITDFWHALTTQIRAQCGSKTEKFSRQVLAQMWPLSIMSKVCDQLSNYGL